MQVSKLLQYSPVRRYSALQALTHPFFDELRDQSTTLPNGMSCCAVFWNENHFPSVCDCTEHLIVVDRRMLEPSVVCWQHSWLWDCDISQGALIFKCLQGLLVYKRHNIWAPSPPKAKIKASTHTMYNVCMKGRQCNTELSNCCRPRTATALQLAEGRAESRRPCNRGSAAAGCIVSIILASSCTGWWQLVRFSTPQGALSASSAQAAMRPGGSHAPRGLCHPLWAARDDLLALSHRSISETDRITQQMLRLHSSSQGPDADRHS